MAYHKISWSFIDAKTAIKAIDALGANSLAIYLYINNKKIDAINCKIFNNFDANKRAKKEIRKFFKQNQGINDFVEFIKN